MNQFRIELSKHLRIIEDSHSPILDIFDQKIWKEYYHIRLMRY